MTLIKYQVFDGCRFLGIRTSYENETLEETKKRLIKDEGMDKNIDIFHFKTVCPEKSL